MTTHEGVFLLLSRIQASLRLRNPHNRESSFGLSVLAGTLVTVCILLATYVPQLSAGTRWQEIDVMPFDAADVFAALAAITAAMIALQVMAQTSHVRPSKTLVEYNRRQTMGMLALLGPAVSCMLALFVWIDPDTRLPAMLPYLVVVASLAGINCFIASDAVDRIVRIDKNNVGLKIAVARKKVSHYRRSRLPWMASWTKVRVALAGLVQILLLSALILILDASLTELPPISSWPGRYVLVLGAQAALFVSFAAFGWARIRIDRTEQWLMGLLCLLIVTAGVLVPLAPPTDSSTHS